MVSLFPLGQGVDTAPVCQQPGGAVGKITSAWGDTLRVE